MNPSCEPHVAESLNLEAINSGSNALNPKPASFFIVEFGRLYAESKATQAT